MRYLTIYIPSLVLDVMAFMVRAIFMLPGKQQNYLTNLLKKVILLVLIWGMAVLYVRLKMVTVSIQVWALRHLKG